MVQLMPLPPHVSCFITIQTGLTCLVPVYRGSPGKEAIKRVSICVSVITRLTFQIKIFLISTHSCVILSTHVMRCYIGYVTCMMYYGIWLMSVIFFIAVRIRTSVFGQLFQVTIHPMLQDCCSLCVVCLSCLSVTLVYCGQMVGWIKMPLSTEVGLSPGDIVLDGDPSAPPQKGHSSPLHFLAHVSFGRTVAHPINC